MDKRTLQAFELSSGFFPISASKQLASISSHEIYTALNSQLPSTSENSRDSKEKSRSQKNHTRTIHLQKSHLSNLVPAFECPYTVLVTSNKHPVQMKLSVSGDSQMKDYCTKGSSTSLQSSATAQQLVKIHM